MNTSQERQVPRVPRADDRGNGPWSPTLIALISLVFSSGGAILTVQNLYRLRQVDRGRAQRQGALMLVIFALGYGTLVALAPMSPGSMSSQDTTESALVSIAVALGSYIVQFRPYRQYRADTSSPGGSWLQAIGLAFAYEVITLLLAVPVTAVVHVMLGGRL